MTVINLLLIVKAKILGWKELIQLTVSAVTILILVFAPFKSIYVHADRSLFKEARESLIQEIEAGQRTISSDGLVYVTSGERKALGIESAYVCRLSDHTYGIMFVTNSGLLETSSGFLYTAGSLGEEKEYPYCDGFTAIIELNGKWCYGTTG